MPRLWGPIAIGVAVAGGVIGILEWQRRTAPPSAPSRPSARRTTPAARAPEVAVPTRASALVPPPPVLAVPPADPGWDLEPLPEPATEPAVARPAPAPGEAPPADAARELAEVEARLAASGVDPVAAIVESATDLRTALLALQALPEVQRHSAEWKLGERWTTRRNLDEILLALRGEDDPGRLASLAGIMRGGAGYYHRSPEYLDGVYQVLLDGKPAARRRAAAYAGRSDGLNAPPPWCAAFASAFARETDPSVLVALASAADTALGSAQGDRCRAVQKAAEAAANRMPAGPERREVLGTIFRARTRAHGIYWMFSAWRSSRDPDMREDMAAAIARAGNSGQWNDPEPRADIRAQRAADAAVTLAEVLRETRDPKTRYQLLRGCAFGLGSLLPTDAAGAALLREIALREPDERRRDRLDRAADALIRDASGAEFVRAIGGRE